MEMSCFGELGGPYAPTQPYALYGSQRLTVGAKQHNNYTEPEQRNNTQTKNLFCRTFDHKQHNRVENLTTN